MAEYVFTVRRDAWLWFLNKLCFCNKSDTEIWTKALSRNRLIQVMSKQTFGHLKLISNTDEWVKVLA